MSPQTRTFLDEKRIYVSWGLLVLAVITAIMVGKILAQLDQILPIVTQFQDLKVDFASLRTDFNNLKAEVINSNNDINNIRTQLHLYNIDTKQP